MQKEQIWETITKNPVFFLATTEGAEPRVRGMLLYKADESGIIFHTSPTKAVYRQIMANPHVQLCFYDQELGVQIRVRGTLELVDDNALKDEIFSHPSRGFMQAWKANLTNEQDFYDMFAVFRLKGGLANVWTFATNFGPKEDIAL